VQTAGAPLKILSDVQFEVGGQPVQTGLPDVWVLPELRGLLLGGSPSFFLRINYLDSCSYAWSISAKYSWQSQNIPNKS
jgi:hypothetical protein